MQVILLERIERLGQMGEVVEVKPGYARNFLLPKKKALPATQENRERFERERVQLEALNLERRGEATTVAERMTDVRVVLIRQAGESGQLYGSVTASDIAGTLTEAGYTVERRQVQIDRPIKSLGIHAVRIALHPEVSVTVEANVAQSAEAAELQAAAERGEPAVPTMAELAAAAEEELTEEVAGGPPAGDAGPPATDETPAAS
jgi:large subunit ribosomal protein L9